MTGQYVYKALFIDDHSIEQMIGLRRHFHQARRYGDKPVFKADHPWEKDAAFVDTGMVIYDEKKKIFKAWYQGGSCYGPGDGSNMCYATSSDGVNWDKPLLGLVEFDGSKDNNIVLMATGMMHDPAPVIDYTDPDPQRRFKVTWWGGREDASQESGWLEGHCVGFSPDGLHWTEHPGNPVWTGDAEVAVPFGIEHRHGKITVYCSADGYGMRVVARTESDDLVNWELPPKIEFQKSDEDIPGTEYGGLCGVNYEGIDIGMLWVIENKANPPFTQQQWQDIVERNIKQGFIGPPIAMNSASPRTIHTELVVGIDDKEWQRVNRKPLIPFGPQGSWDECLSLSGRPIVANDQIYIYYTGQGRSKKFLDLGYPPDQVGDWDINTGLATLRLDGYASLQPEEADGMVVTKPFQLKGANVAVNADIKGTLKLEALDENDKPIDGFTAEESKPITGDHLRAKAMWASKSDMNELLGHQIKLKIALEDAQLYSIAITE